MDWTNNGPRKAALADLIWLAFFFLLRPGKYVWTNSEPHPFLLQDITFKIATTAYSAATLPLKMLNLTNYVGLNFTEQKNGIKNETIRLTQSWDTTCCPVLIMIRQVWHLRQHQMPPRTPLFIYFKQGVQHPVTDCMITNHLLLAGTTVGFPNTYTVGALHNTSAQALLQATVPMPMIKLIGRWQSDKVFRYLTAWSEHLMAPFLNAMLHNAY
jgi:hypothetical protein